MGFAVFFDRLSVAFETGQIDHTLISRRVEITAHPGRQHILFVSILFYVLTASDHGEIEHDLSLYWRAHYRCSRHARGNRCLS